MKDKKARASIETLVSTHSDLITALQSPLRQRHDLAMFYSPYPTKFKSFETLWGLHMARLNDMEEDINLIMKFLKVKKCEKPSKTLLKKKCKEE